MFTWNPAFDNGQIARISACRDHAFGHGRADRAIRFPAVGGAVAEAAARGSFVEFHEAAGHLRSREIA